MTPDEDGVNQSKNHDSDYNNSKVSYVSIDTSQMNNKTAVDNDEALFNDQNNTSNQSISLKNKSITIIDNSEKEAQIFLRTFVRDAIKTELSSSQMREKIEQLTASSRLPITQQQPLKNGKQLNARSQSVASKASDSTKPTKKK